MKILIILLLFISCQQNKKGESKKTDSSEKVSPASLTIGLGDWPPYLSKDLKDYGAAARVIKKAFELSGVNVDFQFLPWKRSFIMAETGKLLGAGVWLKNPDRLKKFHYSDFLVTETHVFWTNKDSSLNFSDLSKLKDKKIGVVRGFSYGKKFDDFKKNHKMKMSEVSDSAQLIRMLLKKRVDFFPEEINVLKYKGAKSFKPSEMKELKNSEPFYKSNSFLIISKKYPNGEEMMKKFQEGFKKLKAQGLYSKYMDEDLKNGYYLKK